MPVHALIKGATTPTNRIQASATRIPISAGNIMVGCSVSNNQITITAGEDVTFQINMQLSGLPEARGYNIDLFDETAGNVVAQDGPSIANGGFAAHSFMITTVAGHSYSVRVTGLGAGDQQNMMAVYSADITIDSTVPPTGPNNQTGATYNPVPSDANNVVLMNNSGANTFQIPTNAQVPYQVGTQITVIQQGAGATTVQAANGGTTTVNSTGAAPTAPILNAQFAGCTCVKIATDIWDVVGNIK